MAGWSNGVQLRVTGHFAGIPVAEVNITVSSTTQRQFFLPSNWPLIQTLYIQTSGGTPGPYPSIPDYEVRHEALDFSSGSHDGIHIGSQACPFPVSVCREAAVQASAFRAMHHTLYPASTSAYIRCP